MKSKKFRMTEQIGKDVLKVVDKGLSHGLGVRDPGNMCVEAAVCYALGQKHSDNPKCVAKIVRDWKIACNDNYIWGSNKKRANGLRRAAIAQLGTKGVIDSKEFFKALIIHTNKTLFHTVSSRHLVFFYGSEHFEKNFKKDLEQIRKTGVDLYNGYSMQFASLSVSHGHFLDMLNGALLDLSCKNTSNNKKHMKEYIEGVVQILVKMKSPGAKFLYLTEK